MSYTAGRGNSNLKEVQIALSEGWIGTGAVCKYPGVWDMGSVGKVFSLIALTGKGDGSHIMWWF